jgi:hypothetical protein
MLKYREIYKVIYEVDKAGKRCEFTFIPCQIKRDSNICRHDDNMLNVYITSIKIANRLLLEYPDIFIPFQKGDNEVKLLFQESKISEAAEILKAKKKRVYSLEQKKVMAERIRKYMFEKTMP